MPATLSRAGSGSLVALPAGLPGKRFAPQRCWGGRELVFMFEPADRKGGSQ